MNKIVLGVLYNVLVIVGLAQLAHQPFAAPPAPVPKTAPALPVPIVPPLVDPLPLPAPQEIIKSLGNGEFDFPVTLIRFLDADTGEVEVSFRFPVRFMIGDRYLDCPEKNTAQGQVALTRLKEYADGKRCMLKILVPTSKFEKLTSFGRIKGELTPLDTPDLSLSKWLVEHHFGVVGGSNNR